MRRYICRQAQVIRGANGGGAGWCCRSIEAVVRSENQARFDKTSRQATVMFGRQHERQVAVRGEKRCRSSTVFRQNPQ